MKYYFNLGIPEKKVIFKSGIMKLKKKSSILFTIADVQIIYLVFPY